MSSKPKTQSNRSNSSDQADELKRRARRRLVGSIVLFLTAIIVVPAVIETEPTQTQSPIELVVPERPSPDQIQSPEPTPSATESGSLFEQEQVVKAPVPAENTDNAESPKSAPSEVAKAEPKPAPKPEPAPQPAKPAEKPKQPEPVAPAPAPSEPAAAPTADPIERFAQADVYWVQVVAVRDKNRAEDLRSKLASEGFEGRIESISTDQGPVYRVRVGPLAGSARADEVKRKLKAAGYDGRIVQ